MNFKKFALFIVLVSGLFIALKAGRPTQHASNLKVTNITCNSMQINWTDGDGSARLIVAREGAPTTWEPADNSSYTSNSDYGKGSMLSGPGGNDSNYIVYNADGTNYVKIDSLKNGKTYYFTIFEHDNAGASTLYYTSGAPSVYELTYMLNFGFNINTIDSCEAHNLFTYTNTSSSTIPNIAYTFIFGDGNTSTSSPVNHQYVNNSGKLMVSITASPSLGCKNNYSKNIRIYPKKVAYIDFSKFDSSQCFYGNRFIVDPQPLVTPLPKSFTYNWNFGDSSTISTFKKMQYSYKKKGRYHVEVEIITNVNVMPTGCKDTLRFSVFVPSPSCKTSVKDSVQCFANNFFNFVNSDLSSTNYKWYFGDGDSSNTSNAQHAYKNTGSYFAVHKVADIYGCNKLDSLKVEVIGALNSAFSGLDTAYCSSVNKITLTPLHPGGKFTGYPVTGYTLTPNTPGSYTLSYNTSLVNCNNTVSKNFRIKASPLVELGNDTLITSSQNITLDAGPGDKYLWNTSATTRTILIEGQTAPKGSTHYMVDVTNKEGCTTKDTIIVSIDFKTGLNTPETLKLKVYPNPINDLLTISNLSGKAIFEWVIFNETGQKIRSGNQETSRIDFTEMAKGVYFLKVKSGEENSHFKLIKL